LAWQRACSQRLRRRCCSCGVRQPLRHTACCGEHMTYGEGATSCDWPTAARVPQHCCRACTIPAPPHASDCKFWRALVWVRLQSQHHRQDALNRQRAFRQAVGCRRPAAAGGRAAAVHAAGRAGAPGDLHAGRQFSGGLHRPHPDDVRLGPAPLRPRARPLPTQHLCQALHTRNPGTSLWLAASSGALPTASLPRPARPRRMPARAPRRRRRPRARHARTPPQQGRAPRAP